jgi:glycosyltransferase involved in cell wall biosynthesis
LATFTASLLGQVVAAGCRSGVVRVVERPERRLGPEIVAHLEPGSMTAQLRAAVALNEFDVAIVQHEFGIYGGRDGDDVLGVLDSVTVPVIVIAHTVLSTPTPHQRAVLEQVTARAQAVVTMTATARDRLLRSYRVDTSRLAVIPHGAPEQPSVTAAHPQRPTILTWGLLGPGKGIESVIDALPALRKLEPRVRYRVVGQTHPRVLDRDGEAYRTALTARARALGVSDIVSFEPGYLDAPTLRHVVADADVVVLPYESREQVTSGVLIEAVAAGRPVVATAFPHAVELLAGGAGLTVPHGDRAELVRALHRALSEPGLAASMLDHGARIAPGVRWPAVARQYRELALALLAATPTAVAR